jgi:DNA-binding NtrC family response regulator
MSRIDPQMIPTVQQRSVEELIERSLVMHKRGAGEIWTRFRNTMVTVALKLKDGNINRTACLLQVHRNTLSRWMKEAGIQTSSGGAGQRRSGPAGA